MSTHFPACFGPSAKSAKDGRNPTPTLQPHTLLGPIAANGSHLRKRKPPFCEVGRFSKDADMRTCDYCGNVLIEIDRDGETLIGCIPCNKWGRDGEALTMELDERDITDLRKMDSEEESEAKEVVDLVLSKMSAQALQSYVGRGRSLRALSDQELASKFAEGVKEFLRDSKLLGDVIAEYELRGLQSPSLDTTPGWSAIKIAVARAVEETTDEEARKMASDFRAAFEDIKKGQH